MAVAGISTLGVTFGYGVETTVGSTPASFTQLTRINSIGGISIDPEVIDASALEDRFTRNTAGRADNGGTWAITVNYTEATLTEWTALIAAYKTAASSSLRMWFEVIIPNAKEGFFVVAQPPAQLPLPEIGQNELLTMEINLTIEDYVGLATMVALS